MNATSNLFGAVANVFSTGCQTH